MCFWISDWQEAVEAAWDRYQEMSEIARESGDPDDTEAAYDAYLAAADLEAEALARGKIAL
jgi:hypothetical protein